MRFFQTGQWVAKDRILIQFEPKKKTPNNWTKKTCHPISLGVLYLKNNVVKRYGKLDLVPSYFFAVSFARPVISGVCKTFLLCWRKSLRDDSQLRQFLLEVDFRLTSNPTNDSVLISQTFASFNESTISTSFINMFKTPLKIQGCKMIFKSLTVVPAHFFRVFI